jgi:hypothetical protein
MKTSHYSPLAFAFALCALVWVSGCKGATEQREAAINKDPNGNTVAVADMLNKDRLITIPDVKTKTDFYVNEYRSGKMPREQAAKELRLWITQYVAAHPDEVKKVQAAYASPGTVPPAGVPPGRSQSSAASQTQGAAAVPAPTQPPAKR